MNSSKIPEKLYDLKSSILAMKEQRAILASSVAIADDQLQSMNTSKVFSTASARRLRRECTRALESHRVRDRQRDVQLKVLKSIGNLIGYHVRGSKTLMSDRASAEESLGKLEVAIGVEKSRGVRQTEKIKTAQNLDSHELSIVHQEGKHANSLQNLSNIQLNVAEVRILILFLIS